MNHGLLFAQTVVLVVLSATILYPVVAYARNVMHTWAIVLLAATLLIFTASAVVEQFTPYVALSEGIHAVSDLTFLGAFWLFARDFVRTSPEPFEPGRGGDAPSFDETGGFEQADVDGGNDANGE